MKRALLVGWLVLVGATGCATPRPPEPEPSALERRLGAAAPPGLPDDPAALAWRLVESPRRFRLLTGDSIRADGTGAPRAPILLSLHLRSLEHDPLSEQTIDLLAERATVDLGFAARLGDLYAEVLAAEGVERPMHLALVVARGARPGLRRAALLWLLANTDFPWPAHRWDLPVPDELERGDALLRRMLPRLAAQLAEAEERVAPVRTWIAQRLRAVRGSR